MNWMRGRSRKTNDSPPRSSTVALIVVDQNPLKLAAWAKLQSARKRLGRATADLHRHEKEDEPGYRAWMASSFPALVSEIRDLMLQIQTKSALISRVQHEASRRGKAAAVVWQSYKNQRSSADDFFPPLNEAEDEDRDEIDDEIDDLVDEWLREQGVDPLSPEAEEMRDFARAQRRDTPPEPTDEAKEIYRRLVQRLHPDRGGEWTSEREALWHEVQRAWEAHDADWLSRLEAEMEISVETIGPTSALGRLLNALKEIEAARRDTEKKLRGYRKTPAWRFTLRPRTDREVADLASALRDDRDLLRAQLESLEATFARWEKPLGQARARERTVAADRPRSW